MAGDQRIPPPAKVPAIPRSAQINSQIPLEREAILRALAGIQSEVKEAVSRTVETINRNVATQIAELTDDYGKRIRRLEELALEHKTVTLAVEELKLDLRQFLTSMAEVRAAVMRIEASDKLQQRDLAELQAMARQEGKTQGRTHGTAYGAAAATVVATVITGIAQAMPTITSVLKTLVH